MNKAIRALNGMQLAGRPVYVRVSDNNKQPQQQQQQPRRRPSPRGAGEGGARPMYTTHGGGRGFHGAGAASVLESRAQFHTFVSSHQNHPQYGAGTAVAAASYSHQYGSCYYNHGGQLETQQLQQQADAEDGCDLDLEYLVNLTLREASDVDELE